MKKVWIVVCTWLVNGNRTTGIDGVFGSKSKAEGWAESLEMPDDYEEKPVKKIDVEWFDKWTVRYWENSNGDEYWVSIVEEEVQ